MPNGFTCCGLTWLRMTPWPATTMPASSQQGPRLDFAAWHQSGRATRGSYQVAGTCTRRVNDDMPLGDTS
eukprot:scaffold270782_cov21-Tisochrysis_lutea.AAC.3